MEYNGLNVGWFLDKITENGLPLQQVENSTQITINSYVIKLKL